MFTYSHEEGTRAGDWQDDVPAAVKRARRDRIMRLQARIAARRRKAQVGRTLPVMVDGPSPDSPLVVTGRLEGQAPDIDSVVVFSDCDPTTLHAGSVVQARVTGAHGYDLVRRSVARPVSDLLYFGVV